MQSNDRTFARWSKVLKFLSEIVEKKPSILLFLAVK